MKILKTILKLTILFGAAAYLFYALIGLNKPVKDQVCTGLDIVVKDPSNTHFINENEVREILVANKLFPEGKALEKVSLSQLEKVLTSNPYIDEALCYKTAEGRVAIHVVPRIPILHVLNNVGEDFYIDQRGGTMPRGHHHTDLIVLTGYVNKATAGKLYAPMGILLNSDEFWNKQIQEIYITQNGEMEVTPRVGDHVILLGDTSDLSDKLRRMRIFYTEGLNKAGWNLYKTINLKFKDQVICTRKD